MQRKVEGSVKVTHSTPALGVSSTATFAWPLAACFSVLSLAGCKDEKKAAVQAPTCPTCITADEKGFHPSSLELTKGGASAVQALTFTRTSDATCATEVAFPELGVTKELPLNQPVTLEVPVEEARTLTFQCGMGMYKSKVVVR